MNQPRTRQELYDRIRQTSRESFILEDMIRLGFWPKHGEMPNDPADEVRRREEINQELSRLYAERRRLHNEDALIKEARKKRLENARQKRQETQERRERERRERAENWRARKQREVVFLGESVSSGLNRLTSDEDRLKSAHLPTLHTPVDLALALGMSIESLRFLTFARRVSQISHYIRFSIPKKTGGERLISAPMPRLKEAQTRALHTIFNCLPAHEAAHGFRVGRSVVTNATPHVGAQFVVNFDLQDFFPTISFRRVKGAIQALGYSESVATVLALICTEPDVEEIEMDGATYYVSFGERRLPQGAPTSPAISNLICRRLDKRLHAAAERLGFRYTRYADDLTFSGDGDARGNLGKLFRAARSIVRHEGFEIRSDKTRVLHKSQRQEVTGIVVNCKPNIAREELRRFRALLFQIEKDGPTGKRWGNAPDPLAAIHGYANFVAMVRPEQGAELRRRVKAILDRYGWRPPQIRRTSVVPPSDAPNETPPTIDPAKEWWKLW